MKCEKTHKNIPNLAERIRSNRRYKMNKSDKQWKQTNLILKASSIARTTWLKSRGIKHNPADFLKARKAITKAWRPFLTPSMTENIRTKTGFFLNFVT